MNIKPKQKRDKINKDKTKLSSVDKLINREFVKELIANSKEGRVDLFGKNGVFQDIKRKLVNEMLESEMEASIGYSKHDKSLKLDDNRRNGYYDKSIITGDDEIDIKVPRDRDGIYEPILVPKGVRRLEGFDEKVISMYGRGMTVSEIQSHIEEIYGCEVSGDLISEVTNKVLKMAGEWQNRALDELYPIIYLDCIFIKVRDNHTVVNKAVYLALGINMLGNKELLGMWISKTEGAKFWMQVVTELKNRGVKDILIACTDGLKGFPEAINSVFPETKIQLCIVHMVRNSLKFVPYKDKKEICKDLKSIYQANTEDIGLEMLMKLKEKWDGKYPTIGSLWERNWDGVSTIYSLPDHIRKAVYTTNIIESINRQIRKIIKNKGVFPHDEAAKKILFLTLQNASKKWTMPIREWSLALNQLSILFPNRVNLDSSFTQTI